MGVDYGRIQRHSINHPATIGDIPFEVIQKALRLLGRRWLDRASLACRAWRQAAAELLVNQKRFRIAKMMTRFFCGMRLKTIVPGFDQYSIKRLDLDMSRVGIEYAHIMAKLVSHSLSSLILIFKEENGEDEHENVLDCYEILGVFFSRCLRICYLEIVYFDCGDDSSSLTHVIKDGFSRLKTFNLINCRGDVKMLVDQAPIHNLSKLNYNGYWGMPSEKSEVILSIAMKCRALKSISLNAEFESWDCIHKVVEFCRVLEEVSLNIEDVSLLQFTSLKKSEFVAIASLPRLKSLDLRSCEIEDGAASPLARCKGLRHLRGVSFKLLGDVLPEIGGSLISLECGIAIKNGRRGLERIVEYCPNLEYLEVDLKGEGMWDRNTRIDREVIRFVRREMKKLAKFEFDGRAVRLGTDWEGGDSPFFWPPVQW
jgi:hypothetical protein